MDIEYTITGRDSSVNKEKKHKSIKYDGHSFNKNYVAAHGSEAKFLEASKEKGHLVGWFENDANRDDKLKEVWRLANVGVEQVKAPSKEVAKETKVG